MASEQRDQPSVLVVGVDIHAGNSDALHEAVELARSSGGATVHVVFVDCVTDISREDMYLRGLSARRRTALAQLRKLGRHALRAAGAGDAPAVELRAHYRAGNPATELAGAARDMGADTLVVGTTERRGLRRFMAGDVAESVTRLAGCPVHVVKDRTELREAG